MANHLDLKMRATHRVIEITIKKISGSYIVHRVVNHESISFKISNRLFDAQMAKIIKVGKTRTPTSRDCSQESIALKATYQKSSVDYFFCGDLRQSHSHSESVESIVKMLRTAYINNELNAVVN